MRRPIDALAVTLADFVTQRDAFTLVVRTDALARAALATALRNLDTSRADLVFIWAHDFVTAGAWTDVAHATLAAQHDALAVEGLALPALPPARRGKDPVTHARALLAYTRALRPDPAGTVAVWGLVPGRVASPPEYAHFVAGLGPGTGVAAAWCCGARLVASDAADSPALGGLEGALRCAPDFGPRALTDALAMDIDDDALSLVARMVALGVRAGVDLAWGRIRDAAEGYVLLAEYHQATGDRASHAAARVGLAEVCMRTGRHGEARAHREAALTLAVKACVWPLVLSAAMGLAELATADGRRRDAGDLWMAAEGLATALGQRDLALRCRQAGGGL